MATTTNYSWSTPDDTALVKDGAAAIRTLGSSVDTTVKNLNPETTLGDIAYRSSTANVKTRLGLGTAGQVLRVNSGATAPEWATPINGKVLQVVSTFKSDTFTTSTGNTWVDITGFSATITPTSATSKVLILTSLVMQGKNGVNGAFAKLVRGATDIGIGDTAGSRTRTTFDTYISADDDYGGQNGHMFLDSPATTSSTTYKWQVYGTAASAFVFVNRGEGDNDAAARGRSASSIILLEIGA